MATQVAHRRFTVDDYHRMLEAGILTEDDRVELIDGEVVDLSPIGDRHVGCVNELTMILGPFIGAEMRLSVQNPIRLSRYVEPLPDVAVVRASADGRYRVPEAGDVLLLVEVADSSLDYDSRVKLPMYARAGIPEVWLVNLVHDLIERHTEPSQGQYRLIARAGRGESLSSISLPALRLETDAVLGPAPSGHRRERDAESSMQEEP